jgi:PGF-CTERM protein
MIAAVLAVFLALALFAGAASAATAYVYQYNGTGIGTNDTFYLWQNGYATGASFVTDVNGTINEEGLTEGLYSTSLSDVTENATTVKYPTIALAIYKANSGTSINGATILKSQPVDFSLTGLNGLHYSVKFTTPAGGSTSEFGDYQGIPCMWGETATKQLTSVNLTNVTSGTWSAKASFATKADTPLYLLKTTPSKYLDSAKITFTVAAEVTDSITVNKDAIIRGASVLVTVTGTPNTFVNVTINEPGFTLLAGQSGVVGTPATGYLTSVRVDLGSSGSKTFQIDSNSTSKDATYTFTAEFPAANKKAKVTIAKGVVTATAAQESYYLGNDIVLSGTNTESENVYLFIKGSNVERTYLLSATVKDDDSWKVTFNPLTEYNGSLDAGTYTFYAASDADVINGVTTFNTDYAYASISVALKQPFLTASAESSVVAQGDKIKITGTAEATNDLKYYVFGTNKYSTGSISVDDDASYSAEIETEEFAAGQYFVVIQHKMYDGNYNVKDTSVNQTGMIYRNAARTPTGVIANGDYLVVDVATRQSANAAEALCQALDIQEIDDIYVKLTFIVAQPSLTMNTVSDVTKGSALKVSGTTNLKAGTLVTVDVLSTAFTAVEKTSVNSASFITLTTKVVAGADGVNKWEVTFDTTGLNVDTYTIQAVISDPSLSSTTTIKVLEAVVTPTATATSTATSTATATATATPTKTPGFGAFLALAGLGAVAVLVLRRN